MSPKKSKKKPKKYLLEMTSKSLIVWGLGLFVLLVWIFILGVLVGRGYLSFGIMKDKFTKVQDMVGGKDPSDLDLLKSPDEDPKFAFYDELASKKEDASRKAQPTTKTKLHKQPNNKTDKRKKPSKNVQKYVLQIGSFKDKAKATAMVDRLTDRGYPAFSSKANLGGRDYFRVKCGPFKAEKEADDFKKMLAGQENIHGFVTRAER